MGYFDGRREKNGPELVCTGLKVCPAKSLSHLEADLALGLIPPRR